MGNSKAKPVNNTHLVLEPEVKKAKCVICFEETKDGLKCKFNHLVCQECVTPLINSVVSDVGRLKDQCYDIRCPWIENGTQCRSESFNASVLRDYCDSDTLDRYVKVITDICRQNDHMTSSKIEPCKSVMPKLLDALNLRCPNHQCRTVMDPSPDGCCAVRCAACATYTCFLCFQACPDSTACHQHVRDCAYSPKPNELFISEIDRIPALKRIRVLALREVLAKEFIPTGWQSVNTSSAAKIDAQAVQLGAQLQKYASVTQSLLSIQQELYDVNLTPQVVLELDPRPVRRTNALHVDQNEEQQVQEQVQEPWRWRRRGLAALDRHPVGHAQHRQRPPTWRALALGVLTFFVVFAAFMYGFYILASVSNRSLVRGRHSDQYQHQQHQQHKPYNVENTETVPLTPYAVWYKDKHTDFTAHQSTQQKDTIDPNHMYSADYGTTHAQCPIQTPSTDRALQLATGLSCDGSEDSENTACEHLWQEPSAMVVFGEGLVQLTVMVCVLSMAVLFGCLVLDVVSK